MARKTLRIEVPVKHPDKFSKLLNHIKDRDIALGANSPLKEDPDIDMTDFVTKLEQADSLRRQSEQLREQSENLMQQAKSIYGTAPGQNILTPGTLYYKVDVIKKSLMKKYKGNEEALSTFGFNVVAGVAKTPVRRGSPPGATRKS